MNTFVSEDGPFLYPRLVGSLYNMPYTNSEFFHFSSMENQKFLEIENIDGKL